MHASRTIVGTICIALFAGTVLVVSAAARPQMGTQKLIATVGKHDAYKITMADASGKVVKRLKAGTYTVVIHDDSAIHNYELDGPHGKSWTFTSVTFKGTKTRTLKLVAGTYKAYCSPHEATMFQRFTVT